MAGADGQNADVVERLNARAARLRDLTPVFAVFGAWIVKETDDAWRAGRDFDGEAFPRLAQSTIDARIREHGGFARKKRRDGLAGDFTKKAIRTQQAFLAPGGIKPLIDTARAINSQHVTVRIDGMEYSLVGYMGPHIAGTPDGHPPKRNPTAFEMRGGELVLRPRAMDKLQQLIRLHMSGQALAA